MKTIIFPLTVTLLMLTACQEKPKTLFQQLHGDDPHARKMDSLKTAERRAAALVEYEKARQGIR